MFYSNRQAKGYGRFVRRLDSMNRRNNTWEKDLMNVDRLFMVYKLLGINPLQYCWSNTAPYPSRAMRIIK